MQGASMGGWGRAGADERGGSFALKGGHRGIRHQCLQAKNTKNLKLRTCDTVAAAVASHARANLVNGSVAVGVRAAPADRKRQGGILSEGAHYLRVDSTALAGTEMPRWHQTQAC